MISAQLLQTGLIHRERGALITLTCDMDRDATRSKEDDRWSFTAIDHGSSALANH
jgi:hypothetical protein